MSLTRCLKTLKDDVSADDVKAIRALALEYREDGMDAKQAGIQAAQDHLKELFGEREALAARIEKKGGKVPRRSEVGDQEGEAAPAVASSENEGAPAATDQETAQDDSQPLFSMAEPIDTTAFKRWFGDSKVVDANGAPLVVYHATDKEVSEFKPGADRGIHFGSVSQAGDVLSRRNAEGANIVPVYLKIENPRRTVDHGGDISAWEEEIYLAKSNGHDGLVYENELEGDGGDSYVAFRDTQIKSAIGNDGTYDVDDPSILSSLEAEQGATGTPAATLRESLSATITALNADPDVQIVDTVADLPESIFANIPAGRRPKGVYHQGQVYLVASNIQSLRDGKIVLAHELVGHKGVLDAMTEQEWTDIKATMARLERLKSETFLSISDEVKRRYGDLDEAKRIKEIIAVAAERRVQRGPIADLLAKVREVLRRFLKSLGITGLFRDSELDIILANSERYLRGRGEQSGAEQGEPAFSAERAPQTDTAAFKRWFGDSKVVDANGEPLVVYHATSQDFDQFRTEGNDRQGFPLDGAFFAETPNAASEHNDGERMVSAHLSMQNPRIVEMAEDEDARNAWRNPMAEQEEIKAARAAGNDGVIFVNDTTGERYFAAFRPEQIKSAIGNRGTFDPENPNILFSLAATATPEQAESEFAEEKFAIPEDTLVSLTIRKMQDKFKVLKDLQANIQDAGGSIDETSDAYRAEELFHGKAENDIRLFNEQFVEPLAKKVAEFDITHQQLDKFLYAKHAPERNAHIAEINPSMKDGGSGMTNKQAAEVLAAVRRTGKEGEYEQLAKIVYDMLREKRDLIRNAGLEDEGLIDAWESKYQFYVPLKGWAEDTKGEGIPGTGRGFSVSGKESKRALGRASEAASPLSYAIGDMTKTLIRKRKNEVGNAFLSLVQSNPNKDYWQVFTDDNPETDRRVVKVRNAQGELVDQVRETPIPMAMMSDRYFTTKKDGKTYYIKLADERLLKAMKNIGPETNNVLIRTLAGINRFLSALNTSYSPEFVVSNFSRDIQTAILNLQAEQSLDPGEGKLAGEKIAAKTVKDVPTAMRAIYASLRDQKLKGRAAEWQGFFDEFRADGAKTGWFDMKDLDGQAKELEGLVQMAKGGFKGSALKFARSSARLVEHINQSVENAVRLSAYVNARRVGVSRSQAASLAKNMTVNFNRRGELGTTLNALYMFANASIQGVANFARTMGTLKGDKSLSWRNLNNAQRAALSISISSFFMAMFNRWSAGDDEDDENWYDKVPDYVKERNLVIMKSAFGGPQDGSYWRIPLPYGYNVFYVLGSSMESVLNGGNSALEAGADLALAALGSFSPIGYQDSQTVSGLLLKNAAPTVVKPVVEIALNENFMGSSIYSENFPFGVQKPSSSLGRRSTPEAYKNLAEWLNEATGGSEFRSGGVDVNPDILQYLVNYFGGSAQSFFGDKLPDYVYRKATGVEVEQYRVPFLSRITGQVLPYDDMEKFYQRRDEITQIMEEYKSLPVRERMRYPQELRAKLRLNAAMKGTERRLQVLRKRRDVIYARNLAPAAMDTQLKEIEALMKQAVDRFNRQYKAISSLR